MVVVVCVRPPPVPVIVMEYVPVLVVLDTVSVKSRRAGTRRGDGVRAEAPGQSRRKARGGERNCRVESAGDRCGHGDISARPLVQGSRTGRNGDGEGRRYRSDVTVSETVVVSIVLPEVPVTVMV